MYRDATHIQQLLSRCTCCSAPILVHPSPQMLTFGVLTALMMSWDGPYTSAADQLRLLPGQAAQCLRQWAALCRLWAVRATLLPLVMGRPSVNQHAEGQLVAASVYAGRSRRHGLPQSMLRPPLL